MSSMARTMRLAAFIATVLTPIFALLGWQPLAITAGTCAYHLLMRLGVGAAMDALRRKPMDPYRPWFRQHPLEARLYALLQVQRWKTSMPTYDPDQFDRRQHTWMEIAQAMCQAEAIHEIIAVLSFLPLAAIPALGAPAAFIITSILASALDMMFVIMQRYNRPRVLMIAEKLKQPA